MKRKIIDDAPDDQPISSFIYKGTGSSKRLAKKIKISQTKPQEVFILSADLKTLPDAAIKVLPFSNPFPDTSSTNFSLNRLPQEILTLKKNNLNLTH